MKRRNFIKTTAAVSAGAAFAPYILKGIPTKKVPVETLGFHESDSILIYIELYGANDGLNTIIPLADEARYIELRPRINISRNDARKFADSEVYFHPALVDSLLRDGLLGLLDRGNLAVVEGVGYENPILSHFASEKIWLSGINTKDPRDPRLQEGWLGRFLLSKMPNFPTEIPDHPLSISIGGYTPLLFKSEKGHMGISLTDPAEFYERGKGLSPADPIMTGSDAFDDEYNFMHSMARQSQLYSEAVFDAFEKGKDKLQVSYSSGLAQKFKLISTLIAGGLKTKVYYIKQSNYDSHAQQLVNPFEGQHPTLLRELATGISEFMDDAIKQGYADRVVGMTTSEFGRRAHDNGSRGTDHGTSSNLFMFGSDTYVNAGAHGQPPNLNDLENGNLRHEFDFRRTFANVLNAWFGAGQDEINELFDEPIDPIAVINPYKTTSVDDLLAGTTSNKLNIYPNPSIGTANLTFELKSPANVDIYIFKNDGRLEQKVRSGRFEAGFFNIPLSVRNSGNYNCTVIVNGRRNVVKFNVVR